MPSILVTGATGFIGSTLTRQLVEQGEEVRILRRDTSRFELLGQTTTRVEHAIGDVTDPDSVLRAMQDIDAVYHAAAYLGFGGRQSRDRLYQVNVEGTAHVVNAALKAGVKRLVHTSSIAAIGRPDSQQTPIDETLDWKDAKANTAYAHSKHEAEMEIYRGIAEGLEAVIVNPSVVFGPGRPGENTSLLIDRVRQNRLPFLPAGGTNVVDVEDVAAGHIAAMRHGQTGERYLLGGENLTWRQIVETIAAAFGRTPPRFTLAPALLFGVAVASESLAFLTRTRPFITRAMARSASNFYTYSNDKAVEKLGFTCRPFEETVARIAKALQKT